MNFVKDFFRALRLHFLFVPFVLLLSCGGSVSSTNSRFQDSLPRIGLNDLAVLFPLPTNENEISRLIGLEGGSEDLSLPEGVWKRFPILRVGYRNVLTRPELRVVSMRVDPCFRETLVPLSPCLAQLRFVAQPVFLDSFGRVMTRDLALHIFYTLPDVEPFIKKLVEWSDAVRGDINGQPLSVHPLLKQKGLSSVEAAALRKMILDEVKAGSLWRVTFMTLAGNENQWTFGGFDISKQGVLKDIKVAGTRFTRQTLTSSVQVPVSMINRIIPASDVSDALTVFQSGLAFLKLPAPEREKTVFSIHRIENPRIHVPSSVDCVSCHLTTMAKGYARDYRVPKIDGGPHSFQSAEPLQNLSSANPRAAVLRAFGYFNQHTAISDRTIHETADAVESWNSRQ